jgi:hypothetical protein
MENLSIIQADAQPVLEYGLVAGSAGEGFIIVSAGGRYEASQAVSCLVRPEPGDKVLLSFTATGRGYILSVLERPGGKPAPINITLDGPVDLDIRQGGLSIAAAENISLAAGRKLSLAALEVGIDASRGAARIGELSFFGRLFQSQVETVKHIADTLDTIVRRAVQRLTSSYRYVAEHEEIQSASTRMLVEGTLTMQTQNTMHTAEGHIKIDAEQIHLG